MRFVQCCSNLSRRNFGSGQYNIVRDELSKLKWSNAVNASGGLYRKNISRLCEGLFDGTFLLHQLHMTMQRRIAAVNQLQAESAAFSGASSNAGGASASGADESGHTTKRKGSG